jgi:hypothetical protein
MLCCAASFITAAYFYGRLIPQGLVRILGMLGRHPFRMVPGLRALPANLLRNHHNLELYYKWITHDQFDLF